ncbi:MAG: AAA family ATPase [Sphaerochaetaceae bacterium]|nr:AAA family ATPase [Spirochaetales bacterium]MDY5499769.1 AAA family ATPase [Sphaerochaetaceae bacterium]
MAHANELSYDEARYEYDTTVVHECRGSSYANEIIGQPRALRAMAMGLALKQDGYNLFVSGDSGSGRMTAVKRMAEQQRGDVSLLRDIVYTFNFKEPDQPKVLLFTPGRGEAFRVRMEAFVDGTESDIKEIAEEFPEAILFLNHVSEDIHRGNVDRNRYRVNLIVNHAGDAKRPFIVEPHPSFTTLFGSLDKEAHYAHLALHAGSLLRAMGGFLVLDADEVIAKRGLWDALKRFLLTIGDALDPLGELVGTPVRPQLPSLPVKIILVGSEETYDLLSDKDELFLSLFKISAQFDYSMEASSVNITKTITILEHYAKEQGLLPLSDDALAQILRYSSWLCETRGELSTRFSQLFDLLTEADYWARIDGRQVIDRQEVLRANDERTFALGISEEKIIQDIVDGEMLISLSGSKVGVVNGLAVMDRGASSFGTPTVITATVAPGNEGIVNIEHEAGLSGEIHDKGLLILEGYLRKHYARNFPLSIYAGIAFEQNYSEIDGDSASSTELYALLSAIGEIPIRQDVAVTGSVNQLGMIQPVGGINEKIEGFYHTCKLTGLTGHQAVIIPKSNMKNLILPYEVLDAIRGGKFHIYPVTTIDEGMEILTGRRMGQRSPKGTFPQDSFNAQVEEKLRRMYQATQNK